MTNCVTRSELVVSRKHYVVRQKPFIPLAIEADPNTERNVATRSSISVVVSELDSADAASVFGDLGRDAATDLPIQWMTLLGLASGAWRTPQIPLPCRRLWFRAALRFVDGNLLIAISD